MGNMLGGLIMKSLNEDLPPPVNVPGIGHKPTNPPSQQSQQPHHPTPVHASSHPNYISHLSQSHGLNKRSPPQSQYPPSASAPGKSLANQSAPSSTKDLSLILQARSYGHSPVPPPPPHQSNTMQPSNHQPPISPVSRSPPTSNKQSLKSPQSGVMKPR